jgi:hypothetical protein
MPWQLGQVIDCHFNPASACCWQDTAGWVMHCVLQLHLAEDGADARRLGVLSGYLQAELFQLDVEVVTLREVVPPPGALGIAV